MLYQYQFNDTENFLSLPSYLQSNKYILTILFYNRYYMYYNIISQEKTKEIQSKFINFWGKSLKEGAAKQEPRRALALGNVLSAG